MTFQGRARLILSLCLAIGPPSITKAGGGVEPNKIRLSSDELAVIQLAISDFSAVVQRQQQDGSTRNLRSYHATIRKDGSLIELEFIGGIEEVGGGATYWFRPPFLKIERRVLHK
jgi:hypothetical protein